MKSVLIIGGNGFLGTNITNKLISEGYSVRVFDKKAPSQYLNNVEYIISDIAEEATFETAFTGIDKIIFLKSAAYPSLPDELSTKAYQEDIGDVIYTCNLARKYNIDRIVYASSGGTIYGPTSKMEPISEENETFPLNHYGIIKLAVERILNLYNKNYQMSNIVLRIGNPYGKGQLSQTGIGAITVFTDNILNKRPITIFGDGTVVRDYIYIDDVAEAFVKAIEATCDFNVITPIFNIGTGIGFNLLEIIEIISKKTNRSHTVDYIESRVIDVHYNVLSPKKAEQYLDWSPKYTLEWGISQYMKSLEM